MRFIALILSLCASSARAEDALTYPYDGSFADAAFAVETAIVNRGLVVDHVSHVGEMLARTAGDVGSDVVLFDNADVFLFCSAALSREVMEADPLNIVYCPYNIFVVDRAGEVIIGHRDYPDGTMAPVEEMLREIAQEASAF
ncbi:DUF302 domain-containing protein [Sulfitobacter sp. LCG007]